MTDLVFNGGKYGAFLGMNFFLKLALAALLLTRFPQATNSLPPAT
jgi:hypothetical protein